MNGATFVFIFMCENRNKRRNIENKYANKYYRKYIWTKYGAHTHEMQMNIEPRDHLNHAKN
jgi:hypothetical protein